MIYYDEYNMIIGVDRDSIEFFGCNDVDEFQKDIDDISNLFIKKSGYIYKFDNYTWLDFINYSQEPAKKVLIAQKNGDVIEAEITVKEIFPTININNSKIIYGIEFINPLKKEIIEKKDDIKSVILKNEKFDDLRDESKIVLNREENSQKMDISEDFYDELLHDFFEEHDKYMEKIENYIFNNHYEEVAKIISVIKSICLNLKLNNLTPILNSMEKNIKNKNYENVQKFLDIYKKDINLLKDF